MATDQVLIDDSGVTVRLGGDANRAIKIGWSEVYMVSFYKVDAITSVIGYLVFDFEWGEFIEVHDEAEGRARLIDELPQFLPIGMPAWRARIAASSPEDEGLILFKRTSES